MMAYCLYLNNYDTGISLAGLCKALQTCVCDPTYQGKQFSGDEQPLNFVRSVHPRQM